MPTEREELEALRTEQGAETGQRSERQELETLRSEQGDIGTPAFPAGTGIGDFAPAVELPTDLSQLRFEAPVSPPEALSVDPDIGLTPTRQPGIIPPGTTESLMSKIFQPQEPFEAGLGTGEEIRRVIANLIRGTVKAPVGVAGGLLEDPVETAKGLATFIPEEAKRVARALPAPSGGSRLFPGVAEALPQVTEEERQQARAELFEHPEGPVFAAAALTGLAGRVSRIGRKAPKAPEVPATEVAKPPTVALPEAAPVDRLPVRGEPIKPVAAPKVAKPAERPKVGGEKVLTTPELAKRTLELTDSFDKQVYKAISNIDIDNLTSKVQLRGHISFDQLRRNMKIDVNNAVEIKHLVSSIAKLTEKGIVGEGPLIKAAPESAANIPTLANNISAKALIDATKPAPAVKPKVPSPRLVEPPKPVEGKVIGLSKVEQDRIRQQTGLDKLEPAEQKGFLRSIGEAKAAKLDINALETANEVIKSKRPVSDTEHAGMVLKAADLSKEYDTMIERASKLVDEGNTAAAQVERARAESTLEQIDLLTEASRTSGREVARAMSIRRMLVDREDFSLARVMQRAKVSKGKKLSVKETARIEKRVAEHTALEKRVRELEAQEEKFFAEREQVEAKRIAGQERRRGQARVRTVKAKDKLLAQRKEIKKEIAQLGFRVNEITGVSAEGSFLIGKLAVNYIREGALTLEQVVKRVKADIPEITERDVHRALVAKNPKFQKKARKEVTKRIAQMKTQSRLLLEIEKAEKGIFDKPTGRSRAQQSATIRELQTKLKDLRAEAYRSGLSAGRLERSLRTINELQDQLANQHRSVKKRLPIDAPELASAKKKMVELRREMRVEDELARLNEQLRTGEFEVAKKLQPKKVSPQLERKQVELQIARKSVNAAIDELAPLTPRRIFAEGVNTLRTLKATADMSATLRQGFVLSVLRPKLAAKSFGKSFQATFNKFKAEEIDAAIRSAEHHYIREKSKLFLSPLGEGKIAAREEMFMARAIQKVPVIGPIVKASERHMITHLNLLRAGAFDEFLAKYPNATQAELTAWANWVNIATGRGNLGRVAAVANELSTVIFAPRFAISRIQTPFVFFKEIRKPRVRREIAKDMAGLTALGATALTLGKLGGLEVGADPRSPDFGKMRIGNTRIDLWAGLQQPARLQMRLLLAATDKTGVTGGTLLPASGRATDPLELLGRFSAYKLAPSVTIPLELIKGKTIVGEPVMPSQTAVRGVLPLVYEDIYDAFRDAGFGRAGLVGGLTFFGVGANTFAQRQRRKIGGRRSRGRTGR